MDFSDFAEFIGPLVFALIAWLSSYFNKKKKTQEKQPNTIRKQTNNTGDFSLNKLIETKFQQNKDENKIDKKIDKHIDLNDDEKLIEEIDEKTQEVSIIKDKLSKKGKYLNRKKKVTKLSKGKILSKRLKNRKSLKEAIIMKENLDRKY